MGGGAFPWCGQKIVGYEQKGKEGGVGRFSCPRKKLNGKEKGEGFPVNDRKKSQYKRRRSTPTREKEKVKKWPPAPRRGGLPFIFSEPGKEEEKNKHNGRRRQRYKRRLPAKRRKEGKRQIQRGRRAKVGDSLD